MKKWIVIAVLVAIAAPVLGARQTVVRTDSFGTGWTKQNSMNTELYQKTDPTETSFTGMDGAVITSGVVPSAKSLSPDKVSGVPSINFLYEENGTDTNGFGFLGPLNSSKNILYRISDESPAYGNVLTVDSVVADQTITVGGGSMVADVVTLILADESGASGFTAFPAYKDSPGTHGQYAVNDTGTLLAMCVDSNSWRTVALSDTLSLTPTPPTFASASIAANGTTVTAGFSEAVSQGAGYSDLHFNLDASTTGPDIGLTYVSGSGTNSWTFTAASTILQGETVNLDFSGAENSVEDGDGTDMEAVINYSVTNNSTQTGNEYADIIYYDNYDDAGGAEIYISAPTYYGLTYGTGAVGNCAIVTGTAGAEIPIANFDLESGVIGFWYSSETAQSAYYFFESDVLADFSGLFTISQNNASFYYKTTYKQYNTYALPSETWVFVELVITNGTTMDVKINGTSIGTLTGASGTFTATKIEIPAYRNHYTRVMKCDNLIVSNDPARDLYALRNMTGF